MNARSNSGSVEMRHHSNLILGANNVKMIDSTRPGWFVRHNHRSSGRRKQPVVFASTLTPWSATNAQYRANVLLFLQTLRQRGAQPWLLVTASGWNASNYLMGVYVYIEGYAHSDFGRGAAISLLMLLIVALLSVFYVRQMVKTEEAG